MDPLLRKKLWPVFVAEAREHFQVISAGALELEHGTEKLRNVRRVAHSLKGAAGSLGLSDLERLAHGIENILISLDGHEHLDAAHVEVILSAVGAGEQALTRGDAGEEPSVEEIGALLKRLSAALGTLQASAPGAGSEPAAAAPAPTAPAPAQRPAQRTQSIPQIKLGPAKTLKVAPPVPLGPQEAGEPIQQRSASEEPKLQESVDASRDDRVIRVSIGAINSVSRQVENLMQGRYRQQRRGADLLAFANTIGATNGELSAILARLSLDAHASSETDTLLQAARRKLRDVERSLAHMAFEVQREVEQAAVSAVMVREDLKALRMVPASELLDSLRPTIRETAGRLGKQVTYTVAGGAVRLDRRILEELKDPLMHVVRNAIDHGIELPEERRGAGKPSDGRLTISVEPNGQRIRILVTDDGKGLDSSRIKVAAVKAGLLSTSEAAQLADSDAHRLIFGHGVTTADKVTSISGRGVGMDILFSSVSSLGGNVEVKSVPGRETQFSLDLPLTLAGSMSVVVQVDAELAAIPFEAVERILLLEPEQLATIAGVEHVKVDEKQVRFFSLARLLNMRIREGSNSAKGIRPALLLSMGGSRAVFGVDAVVSSQEIVIHPLGRHLSHCMHLGGAALLDDGRVISVLNPHELLRASRPTGREAQETGLLSSRVLVVDDSLTTRSAMRAILEVAGFEVFAAGDGEEAWEFLKQNPVKAVVTDVEMPRLDGMGLTRRIKSSPQLSAIPVIMVTSLDAPADRAMGYAAGANRYLVKSEVERGALLETVRQLLPDL